MQVAERFLIGTHQEHAQVVVLAALNVHIVQRQAVMQLAAVGEVGDLAIAVAGDVR